MDRSLLRPHAEWSGGGQRGGPERRMPERPPQGHRETVPGGDPGGRSGGDGVGTRTAVQSSSRAGGGGTDLRGGRCRIRGGRLLLAGSFCRTARYI